MKEVKSITQRRQARKQSLFLKQFRKMANVSHSAQAAGVSRQLVYYWRDASPSFAKRMLDAENESRDYWDDFVLKSMCELAREGSRQMQKHIRKEYGEKNLKAIMRGNNLASEGIEA